MAKVEQVFHDYIRHITTKFLEQYGRSYATQETVRNTWRTTYDYTPEAYDFLIIESKNFYHTLDSKAPESTSPTFLLALAKRMADYLSGYTMQRISGTQKVTRKSEKKALEQALYYDCDYIKNLLQSQARKREDRRDKTNNFAKAENKVKNRANKHMRHDIKGIFVEVSKYRDKTH